MKKKIGILDIGLGNLKSVYNALEYLDTNPIYIKNPQDIDRVSKIVFPGVGAFDTGINLLKSSKLIDHLTLYVLEKKIPFIGICLGMQLIFEKSEEGDLSGLGWLKGNFKKFRPKNESFTVPHIGWNKIAIPKEGRLFKSLGKENYFYFVHSYFLSKNSFHSDYIHSTCSYDIDFISAMEVENIFCCQFHPEKSQMSGLKLLNNFLNSD